VLLPVETLRPLHFSLLFLKVKVALFDVAGLAEAAAAAGTEAAEAGEGQCDRKWRRVRPFSSEICCFLSLQ